MTIFSPENSHPEPAENCLTTRDDVLRLKDYTVKRIRDAAQDGSLRDCPSLYQALKCWVNFVDSEEEAREWVSKIIRKDDIAVARLAKAFTSVSSTSDLGDSVARRSSTAITGQLEFFLDLGEFRSRAEQIAREGKLSAGDRESLATFLNAWRRQEEGRSESNQLIQDEDAN